MNRVDELTMKLLDQSIDDVELQELTDLTQSPEGLERLLSLMQLESQLQATGRSSSVDRVLDQIQRARRDRVEAGVMHSIRQPERSIQPRAKLENDASATGKWSVVWLAVVAACLAFAFFSVRPSSEAPDPIAELKRHGSIVKILDANGQERPLPAKDQSLALQLNETIETSQATGTAEIVYRDGTRLELLGETSAKIVETSAGSKQITVLSGVVQADVVPQPVGKPLRIVTRAATLEVLGTTLGVEVRNASTQLSVATGRVAMTRTADGQRVEVEAGRFATVTDFDQQPLQSHPFPTLPNHWSEDFEAGRPDDWHSGELVDLTETKAIRAVPAQHAKTKRFVITSQNAWQEGQHGLCQIDEHSVLHLRIRQSRFARITIMIGARSYPPAAGRTGKNLFYTKKAWNESLPADTWKTISVPLRDVGWQMKQGDRSNGPADLDGLVAYLVHVSTMDQDAGLMIDEIWITNDAEGHQL